MIINYGYQDGSGKYFISIDTSKCNGCGECVKACPANVLEMKLIFDPEKLEDISIPAVKDEHSKKIKYSCAPCKPISAQNLPPCITACKLEAIAHSW